MKKLQQERRTKAMEKKAILAERGAEHIFVHPYSGHVYAVTGRYPWRIGDLLPAIFEAMDGPPRPNMALYGLSGAYGIAYVTYDAWGRPVRGMPIRAYKESEQERFMEVMARDPYEAPFAKFVDPIWGEAPYPGHERARFIIDKPPGWVEGLGFLGEGREFSVWRFENVLAGQWWAATYGVPYVDKHGKLKMAIGRHQWEAEEQFLRILKAGRVGSAYQGEVDPTEFGFDMATRMG